VAERARLINLLPSSPRWEIIDSQQNVVLIITLGALLGEDKVPGPPTPFSTYKKEPSNRPIFYLTSSTRAEEEAKKEMKKLRK
jgi:hypothetical protein